MQLTDHFTLEELCYSQTAMRQGIDNTPSPEIIANLTALCTTLLEPARALFDEPFHVDSGYRSPELNDAVGGVDKPGRVSKHVFGLAADVIPKGVSLREAFETIGKSGLPFDQVIIECNAWIHIGKASPGDTPRGQTLVAAGGPGHWTYTEESL